MYARLFALLFAALLMVPLAAAQSSGVRVRVVPLYDEVALEPGEKGGIDMDVNFEVRTTCTSGTKFGVSLVFTESFPQWAGASPEPASLQFGHEGGKAKSRLEIFPAEDAPAGQSVTYKLRPEVKLPPSSNCTGTVNVDAAVAQVRLAIVGAGDTSGGPDLTSQGGDNSPGAGVASILLLLGVGVFLRRRR